MSFLNRLRMVKNKIKELATAYKSEFIANRRHLHANPELSFQEFKTVAFVEQQLRNLGIDKIEKKAETGLLAIIEGKNPSKKNYCSPR
jgi:metal-dependent amidase/aminoacylase/carboxypeptidase family protein